MLLDDLHTYLSGAGLAPIQLGSLHDDPDDTLALLETGGFPSQHAMVGTLGQPVIEEPTVQVVSRSMAYDTAHSVIRTARARLDGLKEETINGTLYNWVQAMQPPFLLERDEVGRFVLAFNIHIRRQATP